MNTIGQRLKSKRKEIGANQAAISEKTGISTSHVSRIENDEVSPTAEMILHICNFLSVSADWLLTGVGEPHPPTQPEQIPLPPDEQMLLDYYRELPRPQRTEALRSLRKIADTTPQPKMVAIPILDAVANASEKPPRRKRLFPVADLSAAAGIIGDSPHDD